MRILSMNPGHDGAVAFIEDGRLLFSLEAEKDSFARFSPIGSQTVLRALAMAPHPPDVVAIGGWYKTLLGSDLGISGRYFGTQPGTSWNGRILGKPTKLFTSSHERSHIFATAALSPDAPVEECVVLVWEGEIGSFYHWRHHGKQLDRFPVLTQPGNRYAALFALADPTFQNHGQSPRAEDAGKLMALTAYADGQDRGSETRETVETILSCRSVRPFNKASYSDSPLYNCGVDSPMFHRAARLLTDRIFELFLHAAKNFLPRDLPLLISGGCGLNCEWNTRWITSGIFQSVFIPPCTNDSGSAIGTGADAMSHFGAPCRLEWSVYAGAPFERDCLPDSEHWSLQALDTPALAWRLRNNAVVAWVQGRCEIGPRALGNRSLLASPLVPESKRRLNDIKEREQYRPIAPVVLREEASQWFDVPTHDPWMLFFSAVRSDKLPAVTHVDGSARVQSVGPQDNIALYSLLQQFRDASSFGVLCNTSLNFPGCGFINTMSHLLAYCEAKDIREIVVENDWWSRR